MESQGTLERSYIVRPGCNTEPISMQVGKVKKQISQVKATIFNIKCLYSAGISLPKSNFDPKFSYVSKN